MSRSLMLLPTGKADGLFVAANGLVKALQDKGAKATVFRPFDVCKNAKGACSCSTYSMSKCEAVKYIANGQKSELIEAVLANYNRLLKDTGADVVVVEGVVADRFDQNEINAAICLALDADLIPVSIGACKKAHSMVRIAMGYFGDSGKDRVVGGILLNEDAPRDATGRKKLVLAGKSECGCNSSCGCSAPKAPEAGASCSAEGKCPVTMLANIPYNCKNYALRASDLASFLEGALVGDENVRVCGVSFDAASAQEHEVLITATVPASTNAAVVVLCDGVEGQAGKATICTKSSVWAVAETFSMLPAVIYSDDCERAQLSGEFAAQFFNGELVATLAKVCAKEFPLMSPAAFRYKLTELARAANKRIALPEGDEPRTVCAAARVAASKIAVPVLYGKKDAILAVAKEQGVSLDEGVEFIDPEDIREKYVPRLVELRKSKGLTEEDARALLQDNVFLATMMLEANEVHGLVSGAVHTTANTIRPALQVIKTAPGASLVSAIFFMLMKEQVYVFGDCALNLNPDADQLAQIAIQSADTAKAFGIDPRVAMITYSTGKSGKGPDVDLMTEATKKAQELRPDLVIDGPLQYDASVMADVAAQKAPGSKVAGKATVFIFPSLSTGNTVYKAVQRSADVVAIGPMLQGLNKPVNDLSRGALVDDIVYTVAITAIQAGQQDK